MKIFKNLTISLTVVGLVFLITIGFRKFITWSLDHFGNTVTDSIVFGTLGFMLFIALFTALQNIDDEEEDETK